MAQIYIGSDHGGYELKTKLAEHLKTQGHHVVDLGAFEAAPSDYPDIARETAEKVAENPGSFGILACGTGIGMCMAANKVKGIRAANCENDYCVKMARQHNNANILCLGGRVVGIELAKSLADAFLSTKFEEEERHVRRVGKIG